MTGIRTRTIRFNRARASYLPRVWLGFEGDCLVERLEFVLPRIAEAQTAQLMMGGAYANAVMLTENGDRYYVDLTAELVGPVGEVQAYIQINGSDGEVWHSGKMRLATGALPDVETEIEARFPAAVETMLTEIADHRAEMEGTLADAEAAADRAETAAVKAPVVGENGNWLVWDAAADAYTDSGIPAQGEAGESGVYVGGIEPTDPEVQVWIDPDGEAPNIIDQFEKSAPYHHLVTDAEGNAEWSQYAYTVKRVKIKHTEDYSKGTAGTPGSGGSSLYDGLARLIKVSNYVPSREEVFSDDFNAVFMNVDKTEVNDVADYKWDYPDYYGRYQITNINSVNPDTGTRSWPAILVVPKAAKLTVIENTMILDCYEPGVYMWAGSYGKNFGYCEFECNVTLQMDSSVPYIEGAQVGQTIVVKAVDENGKPTEWEATDDYTGSRITSLDGTQLAGHKTFEAVGAPVYVSDVSDYSAYAITETGWYLFVRIAAKTGAAVTAETTVAGAAGSIAGVGAGYVDIAVRFDVAAQSQAVTVTWASGDTETFVFKATDLAVRNLDYRTTFYVYDIAPYATWSYTAATDATAVGTAYYTLADGVYTQAAVKAHEEIPADTYYTLVDEVYALTTDLTFVGTAYFEESDGAYTQVAVAAGEAISGLYVHSGVTFEGMARNVTYKCDTVIDCPTTYILPEIEDEIHGCWYEIRFRHAGYYSSTLQVPDGVKVATEGTTNVSAGINMVDLHYTDVGGAKIWRFVNTHSTIPA